MIIRLEEDHGTQIPLGVGLIRRGGRRLPPEKRLIQQTFLRSLRSINYFSSLC